MSEALAGARCPDCDRHILVSLDVHRASCPALMPGWRPEQSDVSYRVSRLQRCETEDEFRGIHADLRRGSDDVLDAMYRGDYQAPPLYELFWRERCVIYSDKPELDAAIRLRIALNTDITMLLHAQVEERRRYGGNVVLEWTGPTGFSKSSCMMGFAERHNPPFRKAIQEEGTTGLRRYLGIDVHQVPEKLKGQGPGGVVMLDEQLHLVGEGSRNAMDTLANLEETLRGTGIDVHFASPSVREHTTSQGILEAIAWSPTTLKDGHPGLNRGLFLYWLALGTIVRPIPLGVANLEWCSRECYQAYEPIKKENLERSKAAMFSGNRMNENIVLDLFRTQGFRAALMLKERPSKTDLKRYVRRFAPSMGIAETEACAGEIEDMILCLKTAPQHFQTIWGWRPPDWLRAILGAGGETESRPGE